MNVVSENAYSPYMHQYECEQEDVSANTTREWDLWEYIRL